MDQTSSLADALLKSPSLLGGLLSQLGGASQNGLFSNLLSQDSEAETAQSATAASPNTAFTSTSNTSSFTTASSGDVVQNLSDLSSTLQGILSTLRQQQNSANASIQNTNTNTQPVNTQNQTENTATPTIPANTAVSASTASTSSTPATQAQVGTQAQTSNSDASTGKNKNKATTVSSTNATTTGTATASTSTASDSSTDSSSTSDSDVKKLADIIAELLMLTQLTIKAVQQGQSTGGTSAAPAVTPFSGATATSGSLAAADTAALTAADISKTLVKTIEALAAELGGKTDAATTASTAAITANVASAASASPAATGTTATLTDATLGDSLTQLLASLQQTVAQFERSATTPQISGAQANNTTVDATAPEKDTGLAADLWAAMQMAVPAANAASATNAAAASATVTATPATGITQKIIALDAGLKKILAALQQDKSSDAGTIASADAQSVSSAAQDFTARAAIAADSTNLSKTNPADNWQSQIFTAAGAAAATTAATPSTAPSSGQSFANAAAMLAAAEKNSGSADTGANMNEGGGNAFSANASAGTSNMAITAEGAQASGTYTFASQLSAFRAENGGAMGLPTVIDQVVLQMNRSVKNGNDQMSLQLQPGDLGKITVKLDFGSDGKVQGTVTADNPKTLDMLQKDSRSLERALQDAGLRADPGSLQFNLGSQQQNQNSAQNANGNNAQNSSTVLGDDADAPTDARAVDLAALAETYYVTPTGVNIRV